jgi:UDPglucose 6-dehydrogenase
MNVAVYGLWHLGSVTAACLAELGHRVTGLDCDAEVVRLLNTGVPPVAEPGLAELTEKGIRARRLGFTTDARAALQDAECLWVTFDTPIDEQDEADVDSVVNSVVAVFGLLRAGTLVILSSQLPVGTTARLEQAYRAAHPDTPVSFACLPENLRLGKAIDVFMHPDRVVAGTRHADDRARVAALLPGFPMQWMSVESAEMTKHAINAFLALSVTFINEIAALCEQTGADAKEVERGLKSEARIGPRAYLGPGAAFAGGTLARDVRFLDALRQRWALPLQLFAAVTESNRRHRGWALRRLRELHGGRLEGVVVAVLGLAYKPGTDAVRRSAAVELCQDLMTAGARVRVHDPAVKRPPAALPLSLHPSPQAALSGTDAAVIATEWADYQALSASVFVEHMRTPLVLDANRFLAELAADPRIRYVAVGQPA